MRHPKRKRLRLPNIRYNEPGAYFITVCSFGRRNIFGSFEGNTLLYSTAGRIALDEWEALPTYFDGLYLDEYVLMPNHLHGVLMISMQADEVAPPNLSVPRILQRYKSITTRRIRSTAGKKILEGFDRRIWQRSYFDRVIRSEKELRQIQRYILENPLRWLEDPYHSI